MSNLPHKLESVFLFAVNTGSLYPEHKRLTGESPVSWRHHVKESVLPLYRKETRDLSSTFTREERGLIAAELAAYYAEHAKETARREAMARDACKTLPVAPVTAAELQARGVESISLAQRLPAACPAAESIPAAAWDEPGTIDAGMWKGVPFKAAEPLPLMAAAAEHAWNNQPATGPEPVKAAELPPLPFHRHESPDAFPETVMDSHDPLLTALDEAAETAINAARSAVYAAGLVRIQRTLEAYKVTYPELEFCFLDAMGTPGVHAREAGSNTGWKGVTWFRYWPVSPNDAENLNDEPSLRLVQELESLADGLNIDWSHVERSPGFFRDGFPTVDRLDPEE